MFVQYNKNDDFEFYSWSKEDIGNYTNWCYWASYQFHGQEDRPKHKSKAAGNTILTFSQTLIEILHRYFCFSTKNFHFHLFLIFLPSFINVFRRQNLQSSWLCYFCIMKVRRLKLKRMSKFCTFFKFSQIKEPFFFNKETSILTVINYFQIFDY